VLAGLLSETGTAANLVNDAHLAALAVEHDAVLVSYDADFGRFSGLRWERPAAT
jgi:predicted nucleic acid-binding protein